MKNVETILLFLMFTFKIGLPQNHIAPILKVNLQDTISLGNTVTCEVLSQTPGNMIFSHFSVEKSNNAHYIKIVFKKKPSILKCPYRTHQFPSTRPFLLNHHQSRDVFNKLNCSYTYKPQNTGIYTFYFWAGDYYIKRTVVVLKHYIKKTSYCYDPDIVHNYPCSSNCPGVLGCDGILYCNPCEAARHGIHVVSKRRPY